MALAAVARQRRQWRQEGWRRCSSSDAHLAVLTVHLCHPAGGRPAWRPREPRPEPRASPGTPPPLRPPSIASGQYSGTSEMARSRRERLALRTGRGARFLERLLAADVAVRSLSRTNERIEPTLARLAPWKRAAAAPAPPQCRHGAPSALHLRGGIRHSSDKKSHTLTIQRGRWTAGCNAHGTGHGICANASSPDAAQLRRNACAWLHSSRRQQAALGLGGEQHALEARQVWAKEVGAVAADSGQAAGRCATVSEAAGKNSTAAGLRAACTTDELH